MYLQFYCHRRTAADVVGTRVVAFSYGSGLASALYSLKFTDDPLMVQRLISNCAEIQKRLEQRRVIAPKEFEQTLKLREETHHLAPYKPTGNIAFLFPGTYHLTQVDDKHRRYYQRVPLNLGDRDLPPLSSHSSRNSKQNGQLLC